MNRAKVVLTNGEEYTFKTKEVEGLSAMGFRFKKSDGTMYFFPMSAILMVVDYEADESED